MHAAKLRVELSQSRTEQQEYLKNVELARVLEKRSAQKKEKGEELKMKPQRPRKRPVEGEGNNEQRKRKKENFTTNEMVIEDVLSSVF